MQGLPAPNMSSEGTLPALSGSQRKHSFFPAQDDVRGLSKTYQIEELPLSPLLVESVSLSFEVFESCFGFCPGHCDDMRIC